MKWSHWMRSRMVNLTLAIVLTPLLGTPSVFALGHSSTVRPGMSAGSPAPVQFGKGELIETLLPSAPWSNRVFEQSGIVVVTPALVKKEPMP